MRSFFSIALCFVTLLLTTYSFTQQASITSVPNLIRYGGALKDAQGAMLSSATLGVTFAIYKQQDGGTPVWMETQNVTLDANGQYTVLLGSTTATGFPGDLFSQQEQRWLGVQIQGEAEQPRVLLVSVPYAFKAQEAETLGGLPASAFLKSPLSEETTGGTYIGAPSNAGTTGNPASTTGLGGGPPAIINCAGAQVGRIPIWTSPPQFTLCNSGIYEATPYGTGAIGILNPNPIAALDVTGATNTSLYYQIGGSTVLSTPGGNNLLVGSSAGANNSGNSNTFVGFQAGQNNTSGSNDIYISNAGPASGTESNAIRIGSSQVAAYIAGIYGAGTSSGSALFIDSSGKLGTTGGSGLVTSFNGRSGAVVPASGDYNFSLLGGMLGGSQLSGPYNNPVTLSNTGNAFYGDGSHLAGIVPGPGSPYYIQNSTTQQASSNFNISGNGTIGGQLNVNGSINTGTTYLLGGAPVLSATASNTWNTAVGLQTGPFGGGTYDTFLGAAAGGPSNTGVSDTFVGARAGVSNTSGYSNAFVGDIAGGSNTSGHDNTFVGSGAGLDNTTGSLNTFSGSAAGRFNQTGGRNAFFGYEAGYNNTGNSNAFYGNTAGMSNTTGSYNTFFGGAYNGFGNTTGNSNIYIENDGAGTENNTIRIGTQGTGNGQQNTTFIAGIYGASFSGSLVVVSSSGQLGVQGSSRRFKEQIRDMGDSTNDLLKLRPVTFLYKPEYDKGQRTLQYGLIAEEVAKVYPELVAYDNDGQPYTVHYQYLTTMLLNEVQKQYHRAQAEDEVIRAQQQEIELLKQQLQQNSAALQQRLSRLEELAHGQVQTVAQDRE